MSAGLTAEERGRHGRRADEFSAAQLVYSLTDVESILATRLAAVEAERDWSGEASVENAALADEWRERAEVAEQQSTDLRASIMALAEEECANSACLHLNDMYGHLRALLANPAPSLAAETLECGNCRAELDLDAVRAQANAEALAAVTAATDGAARHLGHAHPVVIALRKALGAA
jgi:hypothetical protein